jgi:hypothetical protein
MPKVGRKQYGTPGSYTKKDKAAAAAHRKRIAKKPKMSRRV